MNITSYLGLAIGYLLGSIPFTQIIAKSVKNIDLREVGSKNVGARNTTKNIGLGWGIFAGALDIFKSYLAIYIATQLGIPEPLNIWAGLFAIIGHNWPVWLGFRGGKGLGAMMGVGLWLVPLEALLAFIISMTVLLTTQNIFLTTISGFGVVFGLIYLWQDADRIVPYLLIGFLIIIIASLPPAIETLKAPGGIRAYFKNPNKMYEENKPKPKQKDAN